MQAVKRDMSVVTARLEEEIPEDISAFRAKLLDTTTLYDKLIESCTKYLKKHGGISSDAKRRGKMVTDIRNRAMSERRCFANLGASDHIHKDREEGMILGNVLGNYSVMSQITDITDLKYEGFNADGVYLQGSADIYDDKEHIVGCNNYKLGKQKNMLDKDLAHAKVTSTLTNYLGVGELFGNVELVSFKKSEKERYFGIKHRGRVNTNDVTLSELLAINTQNKLDIVYSNEALRQMSIIQMLLALLGSKNLSIEDSLRLVCERDSVNEDTCYRVSSVYLDLREGDKLFSEDIDGKSLEKDKGLYLLLISLRFLSWIKSLPQLFSL